VRIGPATVSTRWNGCMSMGEIVGFNSNQKVSTVALHSKRSTTLSSGFGKGNLAKEGRVESSQIADQRRDCH
jgi:hypothetical protein